MKKLLIIAGILITAAGAFFALSFSTGENENQASVTNVSGNAGEEKKSEKKSCCSEEEAEGEYSENSIYLLETEWTNQDGEKVKLDDFSGRSVVFTMFFASCTYACPILVNDMKKIESQIPAPELNRYHFVLLSIDPERDTPEKLKEFARIRQLDTKRWTLLTGTEDQIMEIAALIGFKFKKENDGQYSHSNLINILNEKGEIVHQHLGLNQDITLAADYLTRN